MGNPIVAFVQRVDLPPIEPGPPDRPNSDRVGWMVPRIDLIAHAVIKLVPRRHQEERQRDFVALVDCSLCDQWGHWRDKETSVFRTVHRHE